MNFRWFILTTIMVFIAGCSTNASPSHNVLVVADISSKQDEVFAQSVATLATKDFAEDSKFTLGTIDSDGLSLLWSNPVDVQTLRKIINQKIKFKGSPASPKALVEAFGLIGSVCQQQRSRPLRAIVATAGTRDASTLKSMREVAKTSLSPCTNLKVLFVGLSPKNSIPTVETLHSIQNRVQSGRAVEGIDRESLDAIRAFLE